MHLFLVSHDPSPPLPTSPQQRFLVFYVSLIKNVMNKQYIQVMVTPSYFRIYKADEVDALQETGSWALMKLAQLNLLDDPETTERKDMPTRSRFVKRRSIRKHMGGGGGGEGKKKYSPKGK